MIYLLVFIEGIMSFLSPCVLPLVPLYLTYIGSSAKHRRPTLGLILLFFLGFTSVFVSMAFLIQTFARFFLLQRQLLTYLAAAILALIGIDLMTDHRLANHIHPFFHPQLKTNHPFIVGMLFSLTWTPCVGPYLASVFSLTHLKSHQIEAALLLLIYCLGLGLPFCLSGFILDELIGLFKRHQRFLHITNRLIGLILMLIAYFLISGYFARILN
ncbi:cytochrome c biogenesis CcdA family protein [Vaginisenegalia massiliensis]|uniref:cytochrome c biogenesis CcdA family protein n=1 Tax=Vaginisenegalia massiliensis TaxID=2058294 RepID=UPI000F52B1BD|nr:cytochrome c biogenesis CcdA family protein [Vaginisenegalia massiliensis]